MRVLAALASRSRRTGVRPAVPATPPTSSAYWGSFASDPSFSNAGLPDSTQTLDTEASAAWSNIWTNAIYGQSSTLAQWSSDNSAYDASRNQIPSAYAAATAAWYTGNSAYLTNMSTIVTNMMANMTYDDPWGGKMYDYTVMAASGVDASWNQMQLEDPLVFGVFSVYVRLLHENGGAPANSVTRLREFWRRWKAGAWSWDAVPGTYDPTAPDNHSDPSTTQKMFMHTMTALCVAGWNLYKITSDTNYRDGVHNMLNFLGYGMGTVAGSSPIRGSWSHLPENTVFTGPQGRTYVRYTGAHVAFLDLDGAFAGTSWNASHVREGIAYYLYRDADTAGGVRAGIAGGCDSGCSLDPVLVTPYTSGGVTHSGGLLSLTPKSEPRASLAEWSYMDWHSARASSVIRAQYEADQTAAGTRYTRHPGSAVGLLAHAMESLS